MKTVVVGSLNTDIVATGIKRFPKVGEHVYGKELIIGPGGKSRNIADMTARLLPPNSVSMIGKTTNDPYGLWRLPIESLKNAGVDTAHIQTVEYEKSQKLPGVALIPIDINGDNQIIVLPGISNDFSAADIDKASSLFKNNRGGYLIITLECPLKTVEQAIKTATENDFVVLFDPGGIDTAHEVESLLNSSIFLIKPNEHEAKVLTGVEVTNFSSAEKAAKLIQAKGIENVFITHGPKGGYLFTRNQSIHIPTPTVKDGLAKDSTGCGDQTIAALCAFLQQGLPLVKAAKLSILAGTLQFNRSGIKPLTNKEINKYR